MHRTPAFPALLSLVESRSAALRGAAAAAAGLAARVPGCPDWSLFELVAHVGEVQRFWAAVVAAGPAGQPPAPEAVGDTAPHGDLLDWSRQGTEQLLAALRAAGPDRGCWAWWDASAVPRTAGAVARHQVQEAAVHAYDAQEAAGRPSPVPATVALDGLAEFFTLSLGTAGPWPHRPARVVWHTAEGPSWCVALSVRGAVVAAPTDQEPDAAVSGPASALLLSLHSRRSLEGIRVDGDRAVVEAVRGWPSLD